MTFCTCGGNGSDTVNTYGHYALIVEAGDWRMGVCDTLFSAGTWGFPLGGDNKQTLGSNFLCMAPSSSK